MSVVPYLLGGEYGGLHIYQTDATPTDSPASPTPFRATSYMYFTRAEPTAPRTFRPGVRGLPPGRHSRATPCTVLTRSERNSPNPRNARAPLPSPRVRAHPQGP